MNQSEKISRAVQDGQLLSSAAENLNAWSQAGLPAWAQQSMTELIDRGEWSELNDRFYRYLEFGTGGMRGRTIGRITTAAEKSDDVFSLAAGSHPITNRAPSIVGRS